LSIGVHIFIKLTHTTNTNKIQRIGHENHGDGCESASIH